MRRKRRRPRHFVVDVGESHEGLERLAPRSESCLIRRATDPTTSPIEVVAPRLPTETHPDIGEVVEELFVWNAPALSNAETSSFQGRIPGTEASAKSLGAVATQATILVPRDRGRFKCTCNTLEIRGQIVLGNVPVLGFEVKPPALWSSKWHNQAIGRAEASVFCEPRAPLHVASAPEAASAAPPY